MSKRGDIEVDKLIGWSIAIFVLLLLIVGIIVLKGKDISAVAYIKQIIGIG